MRVVKIVCDGCGSNLEKSQVAIRGQRGAATDGMPGSDGLPKPGAKFHWCSQCAWAGFDAVQSRPKPSEGGGLLSPGFGQPIGWCPEIAEAVRLLRRLDIGDEGDAK